MKEEQRAQIKLRIVQYSNLIILVAGVLLIQNSLKMFGIFLIIFWYLLFGFLGVARMFTKLGMQRTSNFFLMITNPLFLVPSFKSWYYFSKSIWHFNNIFANPKRWRKMAKCLNKVRVEDFITIKEKMAFYLTAFCNLVAGNRDSYEEYIYLAECTDGNDKSTEYLNEFKLKITQVAEKLFNS